MRPELVGFGAGTRELRDRANVLRVVLGRPVDVTLPSAHVLLETNVDDSTPEIIGHAVERLIQEGALDAWTTPVGMKKGRPGVVLSALSGSGQASHLARTMLAETSTFGVRFHAVQRFERSRRTFAVETVYGQVRIKEAFGDGLPDRRAPEYEDCRRIAAEHHVPLSDVYRAALAAVPEDLS
jgi:uncharacterized protein (DUF111 family)